jgi:DNA invertase Pin-like site-specific DNA recombinase
MLERIYDPSQPYRFARYGRMSDPKQNRRSPDQQFNSIAETLTRHAYPWQCVATYRDDGISGRYLRKRPGFQRLLRDIEVGLIRIDLVVVDTLERLGRADEIAELRRRLAVEYGILVVAADNGFADPTGVVGKAVALVEQIRSTENTRIARHNVLRGKKDTARRGRWPGGPAPFGFRLKPRLDESVLPPEVYTVLEVEPRAAAALQQAFMRAAATGHGSLRLSRWWNHSPDIPTDFKPINPFTMDYRLENPIAIGTLRWGVSQTGVVNDTRVVAPNPEGPELMPNFSPPIVTVDLYERVQSLRRLRAAQNEQRRTEPCSIPDPRRRIAPQAPGLTLKYLLTGLVRCGSCLASLRPVPSGRQSKGGRRYVYYTCPRHYDGACGNGRHVPEDRLRASVVARLRARLFPSPDPADPAPAWLPELLARVQEEQQRHRSDVPDLDAVDHEELRQLHQQLSGWTMSLANPQLPPAVRSDIETRYGQAKERLQRVQERLTTRRASGKGRSDYVDAKDLIVALRSLDQVLAEFNPTLGHLELGKHVDGIWCFADGRVELRGKTDGLFQGAVELLHQGNGLGEASPRTGDYAPVVPRDRGRLRVPTLSAESGRCAEPEDVQPVVVSRPHMEAFSWTEPDPIESRPGWAAAHAAQVAQERSTGKTHEQLATLFNVSIPTIRKSLRLASQGQALTLPRKIPRRRWPEQHFREVARLAQQGMSMLDLCHHFQRSAPLIREALRLAAAEHARQERDRH